MSATSAGNGRDIAIIPPAMTRFHVENFGCRATQADGAAIERQLLETGFQRAFQPNQADVIVLNTCTVTASADQDARAAIRRIHRDNPDCKILVTGCYAQRAPEELAALDGVSWVVGNSHKHQVAQVAARGFHSACDRSPMRNFVPAIALSATGASAEIGNDSIHRPAANDRMLVGDIFAHTQLLAAPVFDADLGSEKTRPNLKVQDGCDNRCSFCIIPSVRGQSRSLPLDEVLREVDALVAAGHRELVLSGINLGRWGRDFDQGWTTSLERAAHPKQHFEALIRAILAHTSLEKLRLSSVEPMDWTDELIELVAGSPRIARHAHLPLQSGSDRILRRMHRKYRPWHYSERLLKIRAAMPTAAIGADVMTGFPGEAAADFEETRAFIEQLPFTYIHVFTFSARPGTPAAAMPHQVPVRVARERNRVLRELVAEKNLTFRQSFVGGELQAITLSRGGPNEDGDEHKKDEHGEFTDALTDNYLKLRLAGRHLPNRWLPVQIDAVTADGLRGSAFAR
jgi:threonylcarbamoyladenosine tRNA methylthiotransferase MtaB